MARLNEKIVQKIEMLSQQLVLAERESIKKGKASVDVIQELHSINIRLLHFICRIKQHPETYKPIDMSDGFE